MGIMTQRVHVRRKWDQKIAYIASSYIKDLSNYFLIILLQTIFNHKNKEKVIFTQNLAYLTVC